MSDFLTRRNGVWHFVRRVPIEFAEFDRRGIVRHSTRIKVADDRTGRRAARIALTLNEELERFWKSIAVGHSGGAIRYDLQKFNDALPFGPVNIELRSLLWQRKSTFPRRQLYAEIGQKFC
ncbi:MAG: hypothetical protein ACP5QR_08240 [Rhizomicrobium sp.]